MARFDELERQEASTQEVAAGMKMLHTAFVNAFVSQVCMWSCVVHALPVSALTLHLVFCVS